LRPAKFEYIKATSIDEALQLLSKEGNKAKILAGGQSLVPLLKLRLLEPPKHLIDISKIRDLRYIRKDSQFVKIGALTMHHDLEVSETVRQYCPGLWDAAYVLGDPLVRNRGTIGGALGHHDPAADYPPVLVSLDATLSVRSSRKERNVRASEFFLDYFTTDLASDELLTEISIPALGKNQGSAYLKMERVVGDFAIVGAAAFVELEPNGTARRVRISLSAVGNRPIVPERMIRKLARKKLEENVVREAAEEVRDEISPPSDIRASSEYRKDMAVVLARRAVLDAVRRAKEQKPEYVAQYQTLRSA
jgi:aerobic carbon-monoxide dehydrogenase medium subunit